MTEPVLITAKDAARMWSVHPKTILKRIADGTIPRDAWTRLPNIRGIRIYADKFIKLTEGEIQ